MSKEKVLVGMSGGVDSSVAALLLKERGYDVTGVTFWLWNFEGSPEYRGKENACCSMDLAEMVADQIDIPHIKFDISEEFEKQVVDKTIQSYLDGKTPNPCARCNRYIRFGLALEKARELGFQKICTGHHARIERDEEGFKLLRGVDPVKDQSYFLYSLGQQELKRSIFPIGELQKEEVYKIAEENELISAHLPESQDLCFVPGGDYREFLERKAGNKIEPGPIANLKGDVLGKHDGLSNYTIGQRRGLGLESNHALYVLEIRTERNELVVGSKEELYCSGLSAEDPEWINGRPADGERVEVKIRYRDEATKGTFYNEGNGIMIKFEEPKKAVTPGQIAVLYSGREVIGGGTITEAIRE